jgi:hypothetical protein
MIQRLCTRAAPCSLAPESGLRNPARPNDPVQRGTQRFRPRIDLPHVDAGQEPDGVHARQARTWSRLVAAGMIRVWEPDGSRSTQNTETLA